MHRSAAGVGFGEADEDRHPVRGYREVAGGETVAGRNAPRELAGARKEEKRDDEEGGDDGIGVGEAEGKPRSGEGVCEQVAQPA